ncbi:hypothetical protein L6164_005969 [Bauhinia variegata]|uniref:Uncharacterized protein n=1 Tax=Bauhinia variegata TaxID=167791 RepID=A0ACB9PSY1_BAUVA|nr:hypothetical protein L6164_005969 [Bauhinia variegata]
MDDDWDLYAIVRSCKFLTSPTSTATAAVEAPPVTAATATGNASSSGNALACLASLTFKEENDPFSFPNLVQPASSGFQELDQMVMPFAPTNTNTATATAAIPSSFGISPRLSVSDFAGSINAQHQKGQLHLPAPFRPTSYASIRPRSHFIPEASTPALEIFHHHQPQHQISASALAPLPNTPPPQPPRSRKRKSQQKKMVCQVTAENISTDMWAWRKYGQKPIKGSPFPRNYYRCSSSKGCAARKQVERSTTEPNKYVVTYTGDHTHPRPTHRNSLAGSTRSKPSDSPKPVRSGSPRTPPSKAPPENESQVADDLIPANETDLDLDIDLGSDDDDILIPNITVMADDFFSDMYQLGGDGASTSNPAGGSSLNSQPA